MMKNIFILALNDFACSLRNKSFYLVFFIPLFIFVIFYFLDKNNSEMSKFKIGLIHQATYSPRIIKALKMAETSIELIWVNDTEEARNILTEHKVHGFLEESGLSTDQSKDQVNLVVLKQDSLQTLALSQLFSKLQSTAEKNNLSWIAEVRSLREGNLQKQTLPTWILMVVLLVAFIILPAQVAEEKEKKLLLALLQTPIREVEWLFGKVLMGIVLIFISIFLLHFLNQIVPANLFVYIAFIIIGGYCFSAFGIFLGFLCRNQASARTLGVVFYLPMLVPAALSDFSQKMKGLLPLLPSAQFYEPLQAFIFEDQGFATVIFSWFYLFFLGSILFWLSYMLMKKRWLM